VAVDVTQMRKGLLEFCVMAQLDEPRYGYELVQRLGAVDGMLTSEGTIYPLLARLHREGLVLVERRSAPSSGPPRKYYRLSAAGQRALAAFRGEWATLRTAIDRTLQGGAR
jgi:PadR family transcriptional regulator PadR